MSLLPTAGTLSYGAFTFGPETETISIESQPVLDDAGRGLTFVKYTVTVRTLIIAGPDQTIDALMEELRQILNTPGLEFHYENKGFGGLVVNVPTAKPPSQSDPGDVAWGPTPKGFTYKPRGNDRAAELTWKVEVNVPECGTDDNGDSNNTYAFKLLSATYALDLNVDRAGYLTRVYRGKLEIPLRRLSPTDPTLFDIADADEYFDQIVPDVPLGFRRTDRNRSIDESKRVLRWTITDEQVPVPLQSGVIDCDCKHSLKNNPGNLLQYQGELAATYTMAPGVPKQVAADLFMQLVLDRMQTANALAYVTDPKTGQPTPNGSTVLPVALSAEEDVFGKVALIASFSYTLSTDFASVFQVGGLWRPVPDRNSKTGVADFATWKASLKDTGFNARGVLNAAALASDDIILTVCSSSTSEMSTPQDAEMRAGPLPDVTSAPDPTTQAVVNSFPPAGLPPGWPAGTSLSGFYPSGWYPAAGGAPGTPSGFGTWASGGRPGSAGALADLLRRLDRADFDEPR